MIDTRGIAYLAYAGYGAICVLPYLLLALAFGAASLWAIIPGACWALLVLSPIIHGMMAR